MKKNYHPNFIKIYLSLKKGAHKADFFRYCLLYKLGGIYIDIKIVPLINFDMIFNHKDNNMLMTVLGAYPGEIFQGILATYPNNKFMLYLINDFMNINIDSIKYNFFIKKFYLHLNNHKINKVILFNEKNKKLKPNEMKDRYGGYHYIYYKNILLFKTRYNDYPWHERNT